MSFPPVSFCHKYFGGRALFLVERYIKRRSWIIWTDFNTAFLYGLEAFKFISWIALHIWIHFPPKLLVNKAFRTICKTVLKNSVIAQVRFYSILLVPCSPMQPVTFDMERKWAPANNSHCYERCCKRALLGLAPQPVNRSLKAKQNGDKIWLRIESVWKL